MKLEKQTFIDSKTTEEFIEFLNKQFDSTGELELEKHLKDHHWPRGKNGINFEQTFELFTDLRRQLNAALLWEKHVQRVVILLFGSTVKHVKGIFVKIVFIRKDRGVHQIYVLSAVNGTK